MMEVYSPYQIRKEVSNRYAILAVFDRLHATIFDVKLVETFRIVGRKWYPVVFSGVNVGQKLLAAPTFYTIDGP